MNLIEVAKNYRARRRLNEVKKLLTPVLNYPKGVIFAGEHLFEVFRDIDGVSVTRSEEQISNLKSHYYLEEDKEFRFDIKSSSFVLYSIETANNFDFLFANGYLFWKDQFLYEYNNEKSIRPQGYQFKNLALSSNDDPFWELDTYQQKNKPLGTTIKKVNAPVINLANNNNSNYFHWLHFPGLINYSSAVKNYGQKAEKCYFYLGPNFKKYMSGYMKECISILGISEDKLIYDSVTSHHLFSCFPKTTDSAISTKHIEFLRSKFLGLSKKRSWPKKIFVSRKLAGSRRVTNEDVIFEYVNEKHGFDRVFLEKLNLKEQIDLFSNCEEIICPHGAALANLAFATKIRKIVEIFSPNHLNSRYFKMARQISAEYGMLIGDSFSSNRHADYYVNETKFKTFMQSFF